MKIEMRSYSSSKTLISSILFFILGAFLFTNPDTVIVILSRIVGGIIIAFGAFCCIKNYIDVKNKQTESSGDMVIGLTAVVIGLLFVFLAGSIELAVRFIVGGWILFCGINRFINACYMEVKYSKFVSLLIVSILLIGAGVYTIMSSNLPIKIIGLIIIVYSILEIIGYVLNFMDDNFSIRKDKKEVKKDTKKEKSKAKNKKEVVKDAKIIEEKKKESDK